MAATIIMASTGTTTPSNSLAEDRLAWPRQAIGVAFLTASLGLLALALPRFLASLDLVETEPILQDVKDGKTVTPDDLRRLADSRFRAAKRIDWGLVWTDAGLADVIAAYESGLDTGEGRQLISRAADSVARGLALSPADPFAWARLGYIRFVQGQPKKAAEAVRMSIATGPHDPRLAPGRMELGLVVWRWFDTDSYGLIGDQVRYLWRLDPERLVQIAHKRAAAPFVRGFLRDSQDDVNEFNRHLALAISRG